MNSFKLNYTQKHNDTFNFFIFLTFLLNYMVTKKSLSIIMGHISKQITCMKMRMGGGLLLEEI